MQFGLSESQQILKTNARKFFAAECPMSEVRRLMETDTAYEAGLFRKMAEQGYPGVIFPEEHGGLGLGNVELALLMEEMGRALVPGPYFSTLAAAAVINECGSEDQKREYLEPVCAGEARAALALVDGPDGVKLFVSDAAVADFIVIVGNGSVRVIGPGARIEPMPGMDLTRKIYSVQPEAPGTELANPGGLPRALGIATMALSAELVGGMQRVLDSSVEYAKTRKQFGKPIGQFQAVQHQLADSYLETESARSAAYYAAWTLDDHSPDCAVAVSIAKMYSSDAARNAGNRAIQVHGGMGFTWENDTHLYYRRFKASEAMLGDATWHRERIASLLIG
jgi:alkylation response protein AidB-like acyl-CoA dehydrogenase